MRITRTNVLNFVGYKLINMARNVSQIHQFPKGAWEEYVKNDPYETRWLDYPLNDCSIVVDAGAFDGDWAKLIYCRYNCFIDMYEPQPDLADKVKAQICTNPKLKMFNYGLGDSNETLTFYNTGQQGSLYQTGGGGKQEVSVLKTSEVFRSRYFYGIDLLKINTEGAEYRILPDLLCNYDMKKIRNILIAFHSNVPDYKSKMKIIRKGLEHTHYKVWGVDEVFESWGLLQ